MTTNEALHKQHVGTSIRDARKALGMSQEELATALRGLGSNTPDWHQTTVSRVENGQQGVDQGELEDLEEILGRWLGSRLCFYCPEPAVVEMWGELTSPSGLTIEQERNLARRGRPVPQDARGRLALRGDACGNHHGALSEAIREVCGWSENHLLVSDYDCSHNKVDPQAYRFALEAFRSTAGTPATE